MSSLMLKVFNKNSNYRRGVVEFAGHLKIGHDQIYMNTSKIESTKSDFLKKTTKNADSLSKSLFIYIYIRDGIS